MNTEFLDNRPPEYVPAGRRLDPRHVARIILDFPDLLPSPACTGQQLDLTWSRSPHS
jgi:hypothetical protein